MDKTVEGLSVSPHTGWLKHYGPVLIIYVLATLFTNAYSMGDTRIYVSHILESSGFTFWDFGHLFWRPLGWLLDSALRPLTRIAARNDPVVAVNLTLMGVAWISGLFSVLLVHALARRFCRREWIAYLVTTAFLVANAFINYAQTGHSYVPGLALLLLALYTLIVRGEKTTRSLPTALLAGAALAGSVGMWFVFVLSVPAILLSPLLLSGFSKSKLRLTLQTFVVFALLINLIYAMVAIHLGIHTIAGLQAWIESSSHGIDGMRGVPRMVFGFARSIINMGNDGRLFKRYVVKDPLNPVSLFDFFRVGLGKLVLFYVFFFSVLLNLLFSRVGRRALALLLLSAVPLAIFALFLFEAGTIDRYLPLYPILFLALAVSLGNDNLWSVPKVTTVVFVIAATISNMGAMSTVTLNRQQEAVAARIGELQPLLKPGKSRVITIGQEDPVYALNVNFPFNPLNLSGFNTDMMADRGNVQVLRWRNIFAAKTLALWEKGGDVWVTKRVFHVRPRAEWEWVENDDPRVTWHDLHSFFSRLEYGTPVGGEDGFVLVAHSAKNEQFLQGFILEK